MTISLSLSGTSVIKLDYSLLTISTFFMFYISAKYECHFTGEKYRFLQSEVFGFIQC